MSNYRFGSLQNWWFRDSYLLSNLKANDVGKGIAVMKCLIALSVLIDFKTKCADSSLSDLESITGLSRPMVIKGLEWLNDGNIISIDKSSHVNRYEILSSKSDAMWAKIPVNIVRKNLKSISNRGVAPFAALKIYLTLVSLRFQKNDTVIISHEKLRKYTKIQTSHVRKGLDVLYSSSMIHVILGEERTAPQYKVLGLY